MSYSKKGLFRVAHRLTKAIVQRDDSYRVTFGTCLRFIRGEGIGPIRTGKLNAPKELNGMPVFGLELEGMAAFWNEHGKFVKQKIGRFLRPFNTDVSESVFKREIELLTPSSGEITIVEGHTPFDFESMFSLKNIDSCMTGCKSGKTLGNGQFSAVTILVGGKPFARFVGAKESRKFVRLYSENQGATRTLVLAAIKAAGWVQDDWAFEGLTVDKIQHHNGLGLYRPYLDGDVDLDENYVCVYSMSGFNAQPRFM